MSIRQRYADLQILTSHQSADFELEDPRLFASETGEK